tara:strand:+ start:966 stop:1484 length:519 start_codon:yes stop_codon:yes gene_type:complete
MNPANTDTEDAAIDVCIIEDHLDYRKTLMAELQDSAGLTCSRGFSAVETAIESIDRGYVPDVVLLDIGLPKMDGITAIPELRKRCPDASILVLTVSDDRVVLFRALGAGAGGYLLNPDRTEMSHGGPREPALCFGFAVDGGPSCGLRWRHQPDERYESCFSEKPKGFDRNAP